MDTLEVEIPGVPAEAPRELNLKDLDRLAQ
jgi:hypothetical protein